MATVFYVVKSSLCTAVTSQNESFCLISLEPEISIRYKYGLNVATGMEDNTASLIISSVSL